MFTNECKTPSIGRDCSLLRQLLFYIIIVNDDVAQYYITRTTVTTTITDWENMRFLSITNT